MEVTQLRWPETMAEVNVAPAILAVLAVLVVISIAFENGKDALFRTARRGTGVRVVNTLFGGMTPSPDVRRQLAFKTMCPALQPQS